MRRNHDRARVTTTVGNRPRGGDDQAVRVLAATLLILALAATPAGAAWTKPRSLPDSTGVAALPRAAMGLNSTVAVAFVRDGVRVAVRRAGGQLAPTTLVSSERRAVSSPDVAISGRGDILVVWTQARSLRLPLQAPYRVRAITYQPRRGWGRARTLGVTPYFESAAPRVVANARGDAAITWRCGHEGILGTSEDAICVTVRRAGHSFGEVRELRQSRGTESAQHQQVAVGPRGTVHVAWTRMPGPVVQYAYRDASGRWRSTRQTLSNVPASRPRLAATSDGALVVAWREAPVTSAASEVVYGALGATIRSPAGTFTAPQTISSVPIFEPEIAAAPSGEVLLAWSTPRGVEPALPDWNDVHWATRPARTTVFGEPVTAGGLVDGTPSFAPTGRLGFVNSGEALLAVGGQAGVRVMTRAPNGEFGPPALVDAAGDVPQLVTRRTHAAVVYATESRLGEARLKISLRVE